MTRIFDLQPFELEQKNKNEIFLKEIRNSAIHHYKHSAEFKNLCFNHSFNPQNEFRLEDLPFMHVSVYKKLAMLSVASNTITNSLLSSSTSGTPSRIYLDEETSRKQRTALQKILQNFFGNSRLPFLIFDAKETSEKSNRGLLSRATALRGFLSMSKGFDFLLDKNLQIDSNKVKGLDLQKYTEGVVLFGFTWLIFSVLKDSSIKTDIFEEIKKINQKNKYLIHIGGWKKLHDAGISKTDFNNFIVKKLRLSPGKITDVYGMTEQLGTIYPDCAYGYKHVPVYSEIVIRNPNSLSMAKFGQVGFIQLISPIPLSYPGISILSDDLGKIVGQDDCPCGRLGKYFVFVKRSPKAEVKGCGDTLKL